jgi:hypothetical protein
VRSSEGSTSTTGRSGTSASCAIYPRARQCQIGFIAQIRETEMIGDDGVADLTVDIKTTTSHKVPLFKLKAWLESSGRDPREAALKSKLR